MTCDVVLLSSLAIGLVGWLVWLTWETLAPNPHEFDLDYMMELERVLERIYKLEQRLQSVHLRVVELEKERTGYWKGN